MTTQMTRDVCRWPLSMQTLSIISPLPHQVSLAAGILRFLDTAGLTVVLVRVMQVLCFKMTLCSTYHYRKPNFDIYVARLHTYSWLKPHSWIHPLSSI